MSTKTMRHYYIMLCRICQAINASIPISIFTEFLCYPALFCLMALVLDGKVDTLRQQSIAAIG